MFNEKVVAIMTRNTANVSFYCRESKKNKDGLAPIELSLVINGKRCYTDLLAPKYKEMEALEKSQKNANLQNYFIIHL